MKKCLEASQNLMTLLCWHVARTLQLAISAPEVLQLIQEGFI